MPNIKFDDDFMFPVSTQGMKKAGMILESAEPSDTDQDQVTDLARTQARINAMTAVLQWVSLEDYSYNALDELVLVVADLDGDFEISEEEENAYNAIWTEVPDALLSLGCDKKDVETCVNGTKDDADGAAAKIGNYLKEELDTMEADDDEIITGFAVGEEAVFESAAGDDVRIGILEATYKRKKVVRDGQVVTVRKRVSGKVRVSAAQKAALRKVRRKAHTAAANLARRKSMRVRKRRGL